MKKSIHPNYHKIKVVMTDGSVLTEGTVNEIKNDDRVIEAYLGN